MFRSTQATETSGAWSRGDAGAQRVVDHRDAQRGAVKRDTAELFGCIGASSNL
jgi:hypothetical protein